MSPQPSQARRSAVTLLLVAAAVAVYYALPVPHPGSEGVWASIFFGGVAVLGVLIVLTVRKLLGAGEDARIRGLVLLLTLTVLFYSWADASVSKLPHQFADLHTKTDSLYFNISTLATVGFGDVHPTGQLARSAVSLQIVFNLVFIGTAVSIISGWFRARARGQRLAQRPSGEAGPEHTAEPEVPG